MSGRKSIIIKLALLVTLAAGFMPIVASSQSEQVFVNEAGGFKISLTEGWQPISYTDAVGHHKTEFVFRDRSEGLLRIGRQSLNGRSLDDFVRGEEEALRCSYTCEIHSKEPFQGERLSGVRMAIYYVEDGRLIAGTYYFLQDGKTVWILRFTGRPGSPVLAREVTDRMARSFQPTAGIRD